MKNSAQTMQIKIKPKRLTRVEKRNAKLAAKAAAQLELCRQAGEFHKAYLEIEYGVEEAKYQEIQARLAALQPVTETVITTEEEFETVALPEEEVETFEALEEEAVVE